MPKLKTRKAASKRIRITKNGKAMKRTAGQNHFNSRESGETRMNKHRPACLSKEGAKTVKRLMPYN